MKVIKGEIDIPFRMQLNKVRYNFFHSSPFSHIFIVDYIFSFFSYFSFSIYIHRKKCNCRLFNWATILVGLRWIHGQNFLGSYARGQTLTITHRGYLESVVVSFTSNQ